MADAEARREARRKRILENSENRMQKVLHQTRVAGNRESLGVTNKLPSTENVKIKADLINKDVSNEEKKLQNLYNKQKEFSMQDEEINTPDQTLKQRPKNTVKIEKPTNIEHKDDTAVKSGVQYEKKDKLSVRSPSRQFELMRITGCLVLAILTRLMLQTGYGLLYFQSIILPFFAFEAALLTYKKHQLKALSLHHSGSMMIGVLMLCGIKPDLIKVYRDIMAYITAVTEDLFFFLFCFFVGQFVIT